VEGFTTVELASDPAAEGFIAVPAQRVDREQQLAVLGVSVTSVS